MDTRGQQPSEKERRGVWLDTLPQVMSLAANESLWSWCFAVLEWVMGREVEWDSERRMGGRRDLQIYEGTQWQKTELRSRESESEKDAVKLNDEKW